MNVSKVKCLFRRKMIKFLVISDTAARKKNSEYFQHESNLSPHVMMKGKLQDSLGFWILRRRFGFQLLDSRSLSVERGFWVSNVSGIPDSKAQDFGFY